ncbi:MAG: DUF424 domain-containing protein [Thermoproteota archaeon]
MNFKKVGKNLLLAVCDIDMLGKTLHRGDVTFHIREKFYKGTKVDIEEAIHRMKECNIVNMVGHNVVQEAVKEGHVHPEAVLKIEGVPHAQIVKI